MATKINKPEHKVTDQTFEDAVNTISEYYAERRTGFALVDTSAILRFWQGLPLSVESALKHAHDLIEYETKQALMVRLSQMADDEAVKQAEEMTKEQKDKSE